MELGSESLSALGLACIEAGGATAPAKTPLMRVFLVPGFGVV